MTHRPMHKKGMAAIIISVLVMSLLMLFSSSYMALVESELNVQGLTTTSNRAMDAAYSGTQYVTSFAQTSPAMYANTSSRAKDRLYFTLFPSNATKLTNLFGSITDKPAVSAANLVQSDWMYVDGLVDDPIQGLEKDYWFRAVSFPKKDKIDNTKIDPQFYMIKSQGRYTSDTGMEYKFQIIAEVKITTTAVSRGFKINRWRQMEYQSDDDLNSYSEF